MRSKIITHYKPMIFVFSATMFFFHLIALSQVITTHSEEEKVLSTHNVTINLFDEIIHGDAICDKRCRNQCMEKECICFNHWCAPLKIKVTFRDVTRKLNSMADKIVSEEGSKWIESARAQVESQLGMRLEILDATLLGSLEREFKSEFKKKMVREQEIRKETEEINEQEVTIEREVVVDAPVGRRRTVQVSTRLGFIIYATIEKVVLIQEVTGHLYEGKDKRLRRSPPYYRLKINDIEKVRQVALGDPIDEGVCSCGPGIETGRRPLQQETGLRQDEEEKKKPMTEPVIPPGKEEKKEDKTQEQKETEKQTTQQQNIRITGVNLDKKTVYLASDDGSHRVEVPIAGAITLPQGTTSFSSPDNNAPIYEIRGTEVVLLKQRTVTLIQEDKDKRDGSPTFLVVMFPALFTYLLTIQGDKDSTPINLNQTKELIIPRDSSGQTALQVDSNQRVAIVKRDPVTGRPIIKGLDPAVRIDLGDEGQYGIYSSQLNHNDMLVVYDEETGEIKKILGVLSPDVSIIAPYTAEKGLPFPVTINMQNLEGQTTIISCKEGEFVKIIRTENVAVINITPDSMTVKPTGNKSTLEIMVSGSREKLEITATLAEAEVPPGVLSEKKFLQQLVGDLRRVEELGK